MDENGEGSMIDINALSDVDSPATPVRESAGEPYRW